MTNHTERFNSPELDQIRNIIYLKTQYAPVSENAFTAYGATIKHEDENIYSYTALETTVDEYVEFDIKNLFGLNIDEFLNRSLYEKDTLIKLAIKYIEKRNTVANIVQDELENSIR